jgi:crotonobetainyl-CoA:carnitine CoA-transferase CaiB-like acyl-CoA transferase
MCMTQKFWQELMRILGRAQSLQDPRFADAGAAA